MLTSRQSLLLAVSVFVSAPAVSAAPKTPNALDSAQESGILPEEMEAQTAVGTGVDKFRDLVSGLNDEEKSGFRTDFIDGTHWIQSSLGALRFFHLLNSNLRRRGGGSGALTSKDDLEKLKLWGLGFRKSLAARGYPARYRDVLDEYLKAWDLCLELTARFPDQDQYNEAQKGLLLIQSAVDKAWTANELKGAGAK